MKELTKKHIKVCAEITEIVIRNSDNNVEGLGILEMSKLGYIEVFNKLNQREVSKDGRKV